MGYFSILSHYSKITVAVHILLDAEISLLRECYFSSSSTLVCRKEMICEGWKLIEICHRKYQTVSENKKLCTTFEGLFCSSILS